jgi:hypothetical protein
MEHLEDLKSQARDIEEAGAAVTKFRLKKFAMSQSYVSRFEYLEKFLSSSKNSLISLQIEISARSMGFTDLEGASNFFAAFSHLERLHLSLDSFELKLRLPFLQNLRSLTLMRHEPHARHLDILLECFPWIFEASALRELDLGIIMTSVDPIQSSSIRFSVKLNYLCLWGELTPDTTLDFANFHLVQVTAETLRYVKIHMKILSSIGQECFRMLETFSRSEFQVYSYNQDVQDSYNQMAQDRDFQLFESLYSIKIASVNGCPLLRKIGVK